MDTLIYSEIEHKILACFIGAQPLTNRQITEQSELSYKTVTYTMSRMVSNGLIETDGRSPAHYIRTTQGQTKLRAYNRFKRMEELKRTAVKPARINIYGLPTLKLPSFYTRNDGNKAIRSRGIDAT